MSDTDDFDPPTDPPAEPRSRPKAPRARPDDASFAKPSPEASAADASSDFLAPGPSPDSPEPASRFEEPTCAEDVTALALRLYGDPLRTTGVVQVVAVSEPQAADRAEPLSRAKALRVLRIGPDTPESPFDGFALRLARARADAILTTGSVLRHEPTLRHRLDGPGAAALAAWRRDVLRKDSPPHSLVLTSGRDLDLGHPLFDGPGRSIVFTGADGAWELESRALDRGVEVVGVAEPSVRSAIDFLRRAFGAATILIEAGPRTARDLYEEPVSIDELMLSVYREPIPPSVEGPALVDRETLGRALPHSSAPWTVVEPSGRWVFTRSWRG